MTPLTPSLPARAYQHATTLFQALVTAVTTESSIRLANAKLAMQEEYDWQEEARKPFALSPVPQREGVAGLLIRLGEVQITPLRSGLNSVGDLVLKLETDSAFLFDAKTGTNRSVCSNETITIENQSFLLKLFIPERQT